MGPDLEDLLARYPGAVTYRFGGSPEGSAALLALVRAGRKRATCLSEAEVAAGETPPEVGRCDIAVDFDGVPQLVTRTLELRRVRFCDMTEEMALVEGEDDDLAGWREGHEAYYRSGGIFHPEMGLIWERFAVVEDLGRNAMDDRHAWAMARDWVAAWNARDLDAVLAHYAEEVEVCSPLVVERLGRADGWLRGKAELAAYFARGMANPALHFALVDVRLGVNAACILYDRENGRRVADTVEFDAAGRIRRMVACYAQGAGHGG